MRIVLNTHRDDPGTRACITGLHQRLCKRGIDAELNDWEHYERYDVAVFMAYDNDMVAARQTNPDIRIGLADPKQATPEHMAAARDADFLIVTGVEQRDVFYRHNRNVLAYCMFPPMPPAERVHVDKAPIVIGYHGNRVHLECMCESVTPALNALAKERPLEFWAIYNIEALGQARIGMPDSLAMKVRHIQWSEKVEPGSEVSQSMYQELRHIDIGILPNMMPIRDRLDVLELTAYDEPEFMYEPFDYLLRFKASCNAARLYPYAQLGIPVVGDFAPSASQMIRDGESGFVACSPHGWFEALDALAASADLRNKFASGLRRSFGHEEERQLEEFLSFCTRPLKTGGQVFTGTLTAEDELARLQYYVRPGGAGLIKRIQSFLRRGLARWAN